MSDSLQPIIRPANCQPAPAGLLMRLAILAGPFLAGPLFALMTAYPTVGATVGAAIAAGIILAIVRRVNYQDPPPVAPRNSRPLD
ncbi:MAG: hypothetical protein ACT4QC_17290 [Planctomycetaceae bacterium]